MKDTQAHAATTARAWTLVVLLQVAVMVVAISRQSLWIDEFWTAYFSSLGSLRELYDLILVPTGSQTPVHFSYYYLWGRFFEPTEYNLRLANLPLFVLGQLCLFAALRPFSKAFSYIFLAVSALHPMVWQYANEARPYTMMYAGAQMILAYLLHLHTLVGPGGLHPGRRQVGPLFSAIFVGGSLLLFGASLLGVFWVFAAFVYAAWFHHRHLGFAYLRRGAMPALFGLFFIVVGVLSVYYLSSLLKGAGGSRVSTTTPATLVFAGYELLGLGGVGPGRDDLRSNGPGALKPFMVWLLPAAALLLGTLVLGVRQALARFGARNCALVLAIAVFPVAVVVFSGFVMQWRVLGRHLIATLPLLNLLFALGLAGVLEARRAPARFGPWLPVLAFLVVLGGSALAMRFAERHHKDDYRSAAELALAAASAGQRVWWAADYLGAHYYRLPGTFDYLGELTGVPEEPACRDLPGVQAVANLPQGCLQGMAAPDLVIFSRAETFDRFGEVTRFLQGAGYVKVRDLPVISVWQAPGKAAQ